MSLIIAEAALEIVPKEIMHHRSVINYAQKRGKNPREVLLDRSYHHDAIIHSNLDSIWKRGRPDMVHFALLEALSTPLFLRHMLKVYVHTINNKIIFVSDNLRLPKSYFRFEGLMMNLFKDNVIKNDSNDVLLEIQDNITFEHLVKKVVKPNKLIGLSSRGIQSTAENVVTENIKKSYHCAFVIGGFPKGHFSESISKLFNHLYSIGEVKLEAHIVISRILYESEKVLLSY